MLAINLPSTRRAQWSCGFLVGFIMYKLLRKQGERDRRRAEKKQKKQERQERKKGKWCGIASPYSLGQWTAMCFKSRRNSLSRWCYFLFIFIEVWSCIDQSKRRWCQDHPTKQLLSSLPTESLWASSIQQGRGHKWFVVCPVSTWHAVPCSWRSFGAYDCI